MYWMKYMLDHVPAGPLDPAFSVPMEGANKALSYNQFTRIFRKWLDQAGYPAQKYSSHSLRRGGATWAAHCGLPPPVIKLLGDWRSQTFLKYVDMSLQDKYDALLHFNMSML